LDPDEAERRDYDRTLRLVQVTQLLEADGKWVRVVGEVPPT